MHETRMKTTTTTATDFILLAAQSTFSHSLISFDRARRGIRLVVESVMSAVSLPPASFLPPCERIREGRKSPWLTIPIKTQQVQQDHDPRRNLYPIRHHGLNLLISNLYLLRLFFFPSSFYTGFVANWSEN